MNKREVRERPEQRKSAACRKEGKQGERTERAGIEKEGAMAKLKSLRKAGTRAIRKLFGREPSVASADANSSSEFDEDNNPNNNNNNTTKPITADNHHLNNHNNHRVDGPVSTSHSPSATTKNNSKYDSIPGDYTNGTMAMRSISQAVRPAKQPVHRLEQNGNKDKERNANSPDSDKENLPPPPAIPDLNNLTDNLEKLGLGDEYRQSLQAKSTEANFLTEEDEIFNAEQARHLDFIQEALDMVSFLAVAHPPNFHKSSPHYASAG